MKPSVAPVLVAGAGPSGLVVALTLLQNNVPVRIIDKEPHCHITQRGSGVWPRTFEVFHFIRAHEIHQKATTVFPMREYKVGTLEYLRTLPIVTHVDPTPSTPYINAMAIGQSTMEAILRSHLEKYGCSVEYATELESFEDDGNRVLARIIKRQDNEEVSETFEASYLIGADGAKGVTRKQLGLTFLGKTREDFAMLIGDICFELEGLDRCHWHSFGSIAADCLMLRPTDEIGPDGFQMMLSVKAHEPQELIADEKLLLKYVSDLIGQEANVRKIIALYHFRPNIRMANTFGLGRVFVAGDAAHVHSPTGGQGLNSGVQDALNLAWKVALVYKGLAPDALLESYTEERLPVIAEVLNITTGLLNKMQASQSEDGPLRLGDPRLNMLGINYRTSSLVLDEFSHPKPVSAYGSVEPGPLVAGDRAPDAPGLVLVADGTETRLFDVFGPTHHTVLLFAPDVSVTADVLEVLREYPRDVIKTLVILPQGSALSEADAIVDRDGYAYQGYLVANGEQKVVVVRPDGVAGGIVHGAEGVRAYFDKIFVKRLTSSP